MNCEYKHVPGWVEWIREKEATRTEEVQDLYDGITEMRNNSQKKGPVMAAASYRL